MRKRLAASLLCLCVPPTMPAAAAQAILHEFHGAMPGDRLGTVSDVGDADGDGFADLLAGAPCSDLAAANAGAVYLFSGRDGTILHIVTGVGIGDQFGEAASGAGDVDGDGCGDLLAGADKNDAAGPDAGSAWVFSGRTGAPLLLILGDDAGDRLGAAVCRAGDVDGDGFADVILGAPNDEAGGANNGSARVISGRTGAVLFTFNGLLGEHFGSSVGDAGDVDGDGHDDLIAGAPLADAAGTDAGAARVMSGADGALLFQVTGLAAADHLGISVAGAGDVNGDGRDDVIVGAPHHDGAGGVDSGQVIVAGGPAGAVHFVATGSHAMDRMGGSVNGAGDVDGDLLADIIFSTPGEDLAGQELSSVRVVSGGAFNLLHQFFGKAVGAGFGRVSGAQDINADGHADLAVGAYSDSQAGTWAGAATVYSGHCGTILPYGTGCGTTITPTLTIDGCATSLGSLTLSLGGGIPHGSALLLVGAGPATIPLPGAGCALRVAPVLAVLPLGLDEGGAIVASAKLPATAQSFTFALQAALPDAAAAAGVALTVGYLLTAP